MSTDEFHAAMEKLSDIQREAVTWAGGPLLVLAGPGSGKTQVLTCRIAFILDNVPGNFRVLALTFTNKAADEMRARITRFVPGLEERLFLSTFHSFCADVLRQHGTHLGINPNFQIYSQDADLLAVLNDAVEAAKKKCELVSDLDKKTLPVIKRLKSQLISPDECQSRFEDPRFGQRMAVVYPAYEEELASRNALDFDSLILKVHELFIKFPAFAKRYRTVYPYICIDEFQDTNAAQYALVRALTGIEYRNLFVVADDDQIIYQWNGASHKRIVEFRNDYEASVIQLPVVYRCPSEIVDLANNLIRHNFSRTPDKQPLRAFRARCDSDLSAVRLLPPFATLDAEVVGVAQDIQERHSQNLGGAVVLARSQKLLQAAETALRDIGLPAVISHRKDEFDSAPFVWLHSILRLANDRQSRRCLEAVCGAFFQLTGAAVEPEDVIASANSSNHDYLRQWIKLILEAEEVRRSGVREIIENTSVFLGEGRDFRKFTDLALAWFDRFSKFEQQPGVDPTAEVFTHYSDEIAVWNMLTREVTESLGTETTLEAFLQELQLRSKEPSPKPGTVVLMTIHGAKGKEFDHVYLIGLVDDEMPSFQSKKKGDNSPEMEEERRNCFVAITRTIESLTLSYAKKYWGWRKEPSRFLFEMGLLEQD